MRPASSLTGLRESAVACAPIRESSIERALGSVSAAVTELDTRLDLLHQSISPVLSGETPCNPSPEDCDKPMAPSSPLEERLLNIRLEIDRLIRAVNRIRERVQL